MRNYHFKRCLVVAVVAFLGVLTVSAGLPFGKKLTLSNHVLLDKIKGGWAGQTIGCTYGGPTEFRYKNQMIPDSIPIKWYDNYCYDVFKRSPGLYDDVYMDLTFLEVMNKEGINAPVSSYANSFANAQYKLWHANQAARYNILNGIKPPQSGYWKNNPHADDIDFQIESDFIGMVCPGMVNVASNLSDGIGHIMNYGDGWYGGVFMAAMYTYAYFSNDIETIVNEALKTIPEQSKYHKAIAQVIACHKQDPNDWRKCWRIVQRNCGFDIGCPDGVFQPFNIDAAINGAYCVIGLLYGNGDFDKTIDIATRCGQDSDCNPATAGGILGVIKGYSQLPDKWKPGIEKCLDLKFPYTDISLNSVCAINLNLIHDMVKAHGGKADKRGITVKIQAPKTVRYEQSFEGITPTDYKRVDAWVANEKELEFNGCAVVLRGDVRKTIKSMPGDYVAEVSVQVDDNAPETFKMPLEFRVRKFDLYWKYGLQDGHHKLKLKWLNPKKGYGVRCFTILTYNDKK